MSTHSHTVPTSPVGQRLIEPPASPPPPVFQRQLQEGTPVRDSSHPDAPDAITPPPGPRLSPTRFAIRNPLVVTGVAVALCLFGLFAYTVFGVAIAPTVEIPQAVVTTTYPGADPATIEANVTRPIEDTLKARSTIVRVNGREGI